jgi:hypothetical protein
VELEKAEDVFVEAVEGTITLFLCHCSVFIIGLSMIYVKLCCLPASFLKKNVISVEAIKLMKAVVQSPEILRHLSDFVALQLAHYKQCVQLYGELGK